MKSVREKLRVQTTLLLTAELDQFAYRSSVDESLQLSENHTCSRSVITAGHYSWLWLNLPPSLSLSFSSGGSYLPAVDFPWRFLWILCPVWILCEWLLLEEEPVSVLTLSSCVADSEIRLHKYTWQHQEQLCVCVCPFGNLLKSPNRRGYLHNAGKWNYLMHSSPLLSPSFLFWVYYRVSFETSITFALRLLLCACTTNEYWWIVLVPDCPTCVIGISVRTSFGQVGAGYIFSALFTEAISSVNTCSKRKQEGDSEGFQDGAVRAHRQSASGRLILTSAICKTGT